MLITACEGINGGINMHQKFRILYVTKEMNASYLCIRELKKATLSM